MIPIKREQYELLVKIVTSRRPHLASLIQESRISSLSQAEREELVDVLSDELIENGTDPNGGVNRYGATVDDLIGIFNPFAE